MATDKETQEAGFAADVRVVCARLGDMLIEKNKAYGDSALAPVRIFSRSDAIEQIKVRIDDKLSRLARGSAAGEDVVWDLLGYLVILVMARERQGAPEVHGQQRGGT